MSLVNTSLRHLLINAPNPSFSSNLIKTAKYNMITFFPLALLYQFTNYFNIYFLIVAIILSIKSISTMSWTIGVIPYLVVIGMSLVREGVEDYKKNAYDKKFNNLNAKVYNLQTKKFEKVSWKNLKVGDVIEIDNNEQIPCDCVIIKSSNENNLAYLQTTNLDGESALKARESIDIYSEVIELKKFEVYVDHPNNNIYKIDGYITNEKKEKMFFNINNILLRGGKLKNVNFVYGAVIYTGKDTKIMQNINKQNYKQSHIEKLVNKIVIFVIMLTFLICIVGAIAASYKQIWLKDNYAHYLFSLKEFDKNRNVKEGFKFFGTYFLIFNNIIPICLMIALEVVKGVQVFFTSFDKMLYSDEGDKMRFFSFRLHEDLGSVRYIFCDKTGTLTKNEMKFRKCSIYNRIYGNNNEIIYNTKKNSFFDEKFNKKEIFTALNENTPTNNNNDIILTYSDAIRMFLLNICVNHSVLTETANNKIKYQCTNPDELALVSIASELGYKFTSKIGNVLKVDINNAEESYEILHRFEFSSARLRSSVIIKNILSNKICIFMKGADSIILSSNTLNDYSMQFIYPQTKIHIDTFAREGLRTLCFCMREISHEEYEKFSLEYTSLKAKAINDKSLEKKVEEQIAKIECGMILLGATALEDKLQENVRKDINEYIDAGIHVWMLTGDKLDTAESIAHSCKLFNDDTVIYKVRGDEENIKQSLSKIIEHINSGNVTKEENQRERVERVKKGMEFNRKIIKHQSNATTVSEDVLVLKNNKNGKKKLKPLRKITTISSITSQGSNNIKTTTGNNMSVVNEKIDDKEIMNFMLEENYFGSSIGIAPLTTLERRIKKKNEDQNSSISLSAVARDIIEDPKPMDDIRNTIQSKIQLIETKKHHSSGLNLRFKTIPTLPIDSSPINISQNSKNFGLILEGASITKCITDPTLTPLFNTIITSCRSVVCSRCAPIQKSDMVSYIKHNICDDYSTTVAVGDGGNDVNMLKAADIGIGIFGKEGYQAAYNSDYAISKFKYLSRLIFYHGRYFLMRNSYFIYYFFYKSVIYAMPNFFFLFKNGYSSTIIYDDAQFLIYNALGSNFLVAIRAVLEEDIDMTFEGYPNKEEVKKLTSDIYKDYRDSVPFCPERFIVSFLGALFHSAMIYYIPNLAMKFLIIDNSGISPDHWSYALICYINIITYQTIVSFNDSFYFNWFTFFAFFLHILCNLLTLIIRNYNGSDQCAGITIELCKTWTFWFIIFITTYIGYLPYYIITRFKLFFVYDIVNSLRYGKYQYDIEKKVYLKKLETINRLKRLIEKFKKYYNEEKDIKEEMNYNDMKLSELVEKYKRLKREMKERYNNEERRNSNIGSEECQLKQREVNVNNEEAVVYDYPNCLIKEDNKESFDEEGDEYEIQI